MEAQHGIYLSRREWNEGEQVEIMEKKVEEKIEKKG